LEEVKMADLIINVLDSSNTRVHEFDEAVYDVLKELKVEQKTIVNVLNKVDLVDNTNYLERLKKEFRNVILVSALKGVGIEALVDEVTKILSGLITEIKIEIPNTRMDKVNLIYEKGRVYKREDRANSVYIEAVVPLKLKKLL